MMRLIDAEKLCLYLADIQLANRGWKDDYCEVLDDIISIIDEQTTIEVEPVRHGRWVRLSYGCYADGSPVYDEWECAEDAVEVVRCRDCSRANQYDDGSDNFVCSLGGTKKGSGFCSEGERR